MSELQNSSPAPLAQRENTKLGIWVFLGGEVIFFVSLILLIIFARLTQTDYDAQFRNHLSIPIIAINTFVLVTSSYFVVRALAAISERDDQKGLRNNLLMVIVLGLVFLAGQAFEWITLFGEGVGISSAYGSPFFNVTGIHGTHVFVGILWAIYLLVGQRRIPLTQATHIGVENFGLYWHFVDIVWIVLFTVIYLL
ncbi:MAG TPA: heme-copper oxidase subunit III [Bellilinea sp.]|nr:heme-copper oxidase subunit III [Bellilinea sp.]